jgi:hypothetical protein
MKKIITLSVFSLLLLTAGKLAAQEYYTMLGYNTAFAVGKTHDFMNDFSWRGYLFEIGGFIDRETSFGVGTSFSGFYQEQFNQYYTTNDTKGNTTTVYGNNYRYLNMYPVYAIARRYFVDHDNEATPFAGIGIGGMSVRRELDIGSFPFVDKAWQFLLTGEAGLTFNFLRGNGLALSAKYNYGFSNNILPATTTVSICLALHYSK